MKQALGSGNGVGANEMQSCFVGRYGCPTRNCTISSNDGNTDNMPSFSPKSIKSWVGYLVNDERFVQKHLKYNIVLIKLHPTI